MKLKGNQLKRVRRYRLNYLRRKVNRIKQVLRKCTKAPVLSGSWAYIDAGKQMSQPLPIAINKDASGRDIDAMALCKLFGVPYELYEAEQSKMK